MRPFVLACFVAVAIAGESEPLLRLTAPDGARLAARWRESVYAKLWAEPSFARTREAVNERLADAKHASGLDLPALVAGFKDLDLVVSDLPHGDGGGLRLRAQADCGEQTGAVLAYLRAQAGTDQVRPGAVDGADEAFVVAETVNGDVVVARFGARVVIAVGEPCALRPAPPAGDDDVVAGLDYPRLVEAISPIADGARRTELVRLERDFVGTVDYRLRLVADGLEERIRTSRGSPGSLPLDRARLALLPAPSLLGAAMGIDPPALWAWLLGFADQFAPGVTVAAPEAELAANVEIPAGDPAPAGGDARARMEAARAKAGISDPVLTGLKGTWGLMVTPAAPFPAVTLAVPRDDAVDAWIAGLLAKVDQQPPAVGEPLLVAAPDIGLPLTLLRTADGWLVTSGAAIAADWAKGVTGGWAATPAAAQALAALPDATSVATLDTGAVISALTPTLGMFMASLPPKRRAGIFDALGVAQKLLPSTWLAAKRDGDATVIETHGPIGIGVLPAIAALAAYSPRQLLTSRVAANEAAAANRLKSAVHPAEIQFQAGSYVDDDANGEGDFGFFAEMSGGPVGSHKDAPQLSLLPAAWRAERPVFEGYRFAVYVAAGPHDGSSSPTARARNQLGGDAGFVAYAWPTERKAGGRTFAITAEGVVYVGPLATDAAPPAWNALWGGGDHGWDDPVQWKPLVEPGEPSEAPPIQEMDIPVEQVAAPAVEP